MSRKKTETSVKPLAVRIKQAGPMIGVGRSYIYELINSGELEAYKEGAATLIPVASLERHVAKRLAEATVAKGNQKS